MYVRDLGEFGLIERLVQQVAAATPILQAKTHESTNLTVTIGDDTGAWTVGGVTELLTTDTVVQGVHFTAETSTWKTVGWKCLASNLSDIASMGGRPTFAVVTLGIPDDTLVEDIDNLYAGLLDASTTYDVTIIGGDIVASPAFFMTIAQTGVTNAAPMLRSSALPGDLIAVTGTLGASAAGLAILQSKPSQASGDAQPLIEQHQSPQPRVSEGQVLLNAGVRCAMDVSDGLLSDLAKICSASGNVARVEAPLVPVHPKAGKIFPDTALSMALNGGEDYELLFTASPTVMATLQGKLEHGFHVIGTIAQGTPGQVDVFDKDGVAIDVQAAGWDHLKS